MITIYTPQITERIAFIMDVIFNGHLKIPYRLTDSTDELQQAAMKISYAPQPVAVENEIFIHQHPLLLETDIRHQKIDAGVFEAEPVFFQSSHPQSFLPFDIFALSFYLLTRYEEYLPHTKDKYGRFPATESIACRQGFLQKPLVDILVLKFVRKLQAVFPALTYELGSPKYIATYDIDNAYAYLHKGFVRTAGGLAKQFLRFDWKEVTNRIAVLTGKKKDPYDTYHFFDFISQKYNIDSYYFMLCAPKSTYDRGLNPKNKHFQQLMHRLQAKAKMGIHPSYASSSSPTRLTSEINILSAILKEKVVNSRSHYLLLQFPQTYQQLIANGIKCDFTLGYAELPGFRASTCKAFNFFDLSNNKCTSLKLYPFVYMEETFQNYMQLKPHESMERIELLISVVKKVKGTFISLWHNENFEKNGVDWKEVYEKSLDCFFTNA